MIIKDVASLSERVLRHQFCLFTLKSIAILRYIFFSFQGKMSEDHDYSDNVEFEESEVAPDNEQIGERKKEGAGRAKKKRDPPSTHLFALLGHQMIWGGGLFLVLSPAQPCTGQFPT